MRFLIDENGYEQPTSYEYDTAGKQTAVIDPLGHTITSYTTVGSWHKINTYTLTGTHRTVTHYDGTRRDYVTDANGQTTSFTYDALGRVIKTTHPATVVQEGGAAAVATYSHVGYDGLGRKAWESEVTVESDSASLNGDIDVRWFAYDAAGRLIQVTLPDPDGATPYVHPVYKYFYDEQGNQVGILDALNRLTVFKFNEMNQQTHKYQPFVYTGTLLDAEDVYTALAAQSPMPGVETRSYYADTEDHAGQLKTVTDYESHFRKLFYNALGQLECDRYYTTSGAYNSGHPTYNATPEIAYTYDNLGRKESETVTEYDGSGAGTEMYYCDYYYDAEGRIDYIDNTQGIVDYGYDPITGQKNLVQTPLDGSDSKVEYGYDNLGRMETVTVKKRNGQSVTEAFTLGYDAVGSLDWVCQPNGNCVDYDYDAMNRLADVTWEDNLSNQVCRYKYEVYADGQRRKVTEYGTDAVNPTATYTWSYDYLNRLTQEAYDDLTAGNADYTHEYVYDLAGNRLNKNVLAGPGNNIAYTYNALDQLQEEVEDVPSPGTDVYRSYFYDQNGSLRYKVNGPHANNTPTIVDSHDEYQYNLQNRMKAFVPSSGSSVAYRYNPQGIRVQKQIGSGNPIRYLIDPQNPTGYAQVFKTQQTGSDDIVYILGHDVLARATGTATPLYYLYDGHGSVRKEANSSGTIVNSYNYDAYGNAVGFTPSDGLYYAGEMFDSAPAWYYNRARYYIPTVGRFNGQDTFAGNNENPQSLHKYAYCHENPVNGTDPTGQFFFTTVDFCISTFIGETLQSQYSLFTYKTGVKAAERMLGNFADYYARNRIKEKANATIIVHGITSQSYGWSSDFTDRLEQRAENQDYYEFTWSGFGLTAAGYGINMEAHGVAVNSLTTVLRTIGTKGYSNVNIVSHSWGTVLSRDAQYAGVGPINTWVTMGSPLPETTRTPGNLDYWINIWSPQDRVTRFGPELGWTGAEGGSGYLYDKRGIRQVQITGDHSSYWTNGTALNSIGNQLKTQ